MMMMTMMSSTDCSSSSMQGSSTASSASSDVMTLTTTAASSWCAMPASSRLRLVRLVRPHQRRLLVVPERSASFGFAVRGGKEHGIGFFVSHVEHGGEAQLKGLRVSGLRGRSRTAWPAHSTHTQLNEPQPSSLSLSPPLSPLSLRLPLCSAAIRSCASMAIDWRTQCTRSSYSWWPVRIV